MMLEQKILLKGLVWISALVFAALCVPSAYTQNTWYVPDDFPTIQGALSDAGVVDGDTVIVRSGTYTDNINFLGKAIALMSEMGPAVTTIDGNQTGSVVIFVNNEKETSIIDGFTITNGNGTVSPNGQSGGGIYCSNASPAICNNIITGNSVTDDGGGICCYFDCSPLIYNNVITMNSTCGTAAGGGGVAIGSNSTEEYVFPKLINNIITNNSCDSYYWGGGGICYWYVPNALIINNTICNNSANKDGGGIWAFETHFSCTNSIVWDNDGNPGSQISIGNNSTLSIDHSDVEGGQALVHVGTGSTLDWGSGMLDDDPLFAGGPEGSFYLSQVAAGQAEDSPCVDSGSAHVLFHNMHACWTRTDEMPDSGVLDMGYHYGPYTPPTLRACRWQISESLGGSVDISLDAGIQNEDRAYILLGGVTGTEPGIALPGGMATLPLNWDFFTSLTVNWANTPIFHDFQGKLDSFGDALAVFDTLGPLPSGTAGITFYFAYALNGPWDFVSNPVGIKVTP